MVAIARCEQPAYILGSPCPEPPLDVHEVHAELPPGLVAARRLWKGTRPASFQFTPALTFMILFSVHIHALFAGSGIEPLPPRVGVTISVVFTMGLLGIVRTCTRLEIHNSMACQLLHNLDKDHLLSRSVSAIAYFLIGFVILVMPSNVLLPVSATWAQWEELSVQMRVVHVVNIALVSLSGVLSAFTLAYGIGSATMWLLIVCHAIGHWADGIAALASMNEASAADLERSMTRLHQIVVEPLEVMHRACGLSMNLSMAFLPAGMFIAIDIINNKNGVLDGGFRLTLERPEPFVSRIYTIVAALGSLIITMVLLCAMAMVADTHDRKKLELSQPKVKQWLKQHDYDDYMRDFQCGFRLIGTARVTMSGVAATFAAICLTFGAIIL